MLNTLWKSPAELDRELPNHHDSGNSCLDRFGQRNILVFCSNRVWRGAPKRVIQGAAFFVTLFIIFGLLPERLSGGGYSSIISWKKEQIPEADLRIVVFGSPDILGSAPDKSQNRKTWTEELCYELNCTSHISLVPSSGDSNRGLACNSFYEQTLGDLLNITLNTDIEKKPGSDYKYLAEDYPVPSRVPDLAAQVQEFLKMPPPNTAPRETLWIFTFGTWEIWNLAALPREEAEDLIVSMISFIFDQAELLYRNSLDPTSVAFSDFWATATASQVKELTKPGALDNVDERRFESFRVLIPTLFDISLTPGWRGRSKPPFPNSLAEQNRNAAELTTYWNREVTYAIAEWKQKATEKPAGFEAEDAEETGKNKRDAVEDAEGAGGDEGDEGDVETSQESRLRKYLPFSLFESKNTSGTKEPEEPKEHVIMAPYPLRNGWQLNPARAILNAMTEEEMQRSEVTDSKGRGTLPINDSMRFLDVWTPCVKVKTKDLAVDKEEITEECQIPDDHLFYDSFTVSERAIKGVAKMMGKDVQENLFDQEPKYSWPF
ncbi:hypothetical protein FZEAL_2464 [Fusarium zealandicum]|uniref:Uncharacterized protein n=1 Tax=Fusarium zealandicum TaxID=1053134 RepID=A0A8H4XNK0_9HYPO|nr:hypothetical protein FZEAL_2464 [Fusarium zealandicum]